MFSLFFSYFYYFDDFQEVLVTERHGYIYIYTYVYTGDFSLYIDVYVSK